MLIPIFNCKCKGLQGGTLCGPFKINRGWKIRFWKLFVAIARALLLSIQHYWQYNTKCVCHDAIPQTDYKDSHNGMDDHKPFIPSILTNHGTICSYIMVHLHYSLITSHILQRCWAVSPRHGKPKPCIWTSALQAGPFLFLAIYMGKWWWYTLGLFWGTLFLDYFFSEFLANRGFQTWAYGIVFTRSSWFVEHSIFNY